jgi:hypothetical protein
MKIAVLNPDGRDADQVFPEYAGRPDDAVHAPVNFHAFAACTGGGFYRKAASIPATQKEVLVLLRSDMKRCLRAVEELKACGKIVAVTWKETGGHQIAAQLNDATNIALFRKVCEIAHGAIATTPESLLVYRTAGASKSEYIPTPYPVNAAEWDFSVAASSRRGVLIGTREWNVPSRNHLAALLTSKVFNQPVTVFNCDGRAGRKRLEALDHPRLEIIEKRQPYSEYLRTIARHRIVWQLDASCVPGQVAGDAALCRVPCIGGNGAIDREAFPMLSGHGREIGDLIHTAERLLRDDRAYDSQVKVDASLAKERISFSQITERLLQFYRAISR